MEEYLGDKYHDIKREMVERYDVLKGKTSGSVKAMVEELLSDYGVEDNIDSICRGLMVHLAYSCVDRTKVSVPEFDGLVTDFVRHGGFDKILKHRKKSIFFGNYKSEDFKAIDKVCRKYFGILEYLSYDDAIEEIEAMGITSMRDWYDYINRESTEIVDAKKYRVAE